MESILPTSPPGFLVPSLPLVSAPADVRPSQRELAAKVIAAIASGWTPEDVVLRGAPDVTDPLELAEAVAHADHLASVLHPVAQPSRRPKRLALNKTDAAEALSVSVDFFDEHIAPELRCTLRGRRRLYAITELERWLDESAGQAL